MNANIKAILSHIDSTFAGGFSKVDKDDVLENGKTLGVAVQEEADKLFAIPPLESEKKK
jgi:hypothetical protein